MTSGPITEGGNNAALEFNARGQLMGTGDVAYAYDLENTRTIVMHYDKNKILTQYRYVYNRVGNVPEVLMRVKLTNMTSQSTYYVYGAGLAYEVKITPDGQEAVRYYHYDQVGSTVAMTDSAQAITDRFHYDPWGYVLHSIGDSDTPFQFVGAYGIQTDPNGLINMRARYYNPVTKSFISQDPSGFDDGLNWYLYTNGNPYTYIDKDGEVPILVAAALVGAGIGTIIESGAELIKQYRNRDLNSQFSLRLDAIALSAAKGAFIGAISAIATPASGSIAMSLGYKASSKLAIGLSAGFSAITSGTAQVGYNYASNQYLGTENELSDGLLSSMAFGAIGQGLSSLVKTTGYSTISQATKFNAVPRTITKYASTYNGRLLTTSFTVSALVGAASNFK